jgi:flavin-dependent dehydrogenase
METMRCDILIVGAGPAGASAARAAASRGLEVLMVERRDRVGVPVQCAEFIPAPLLGEIDPAPGMVMQSVSEVHTILPGGEMNVMRSPGLMIRRGLFD